MTITITAAEARELLTRAVEEKGADYVYPRSNYPGGCIYFSEGEEGDEVGAPSCIIGHVFAYKGMEPLPEDVNGATVHGVHRRFFEVDNNWTLAALAKAQAAQDTGDTWGNALRAALSVLDEAK